MDKKRENKKGYELRREKKKLGNAQLWRKKFNRRNAWKEKKMGKWSEKIEEKKGERRRKV